MANKRKRNGKRARLEKTLKLLIDAKALIEDPEHWCQGWLALDALGNRVEFKFPNAYAVEPHSFCAMGAVYHEALTRGSRRDAVARLSESAVRMNKSAAAEVNDSMNHHAVMRMYDSAIRSVRAALGREG